MPFGASGAQANGVTAASAVLPSATSAPFATVTAAVIPPPPDAVISAPVLSHWSHEAWPEDKVGGAVLYAQTVGGGITGLVTTWAPAITAPRARTAKAAIAMRFMSFRPSVTGLTGESALPLATEP